MFRVILLLLIFIFVPVLVLLAQEPEEPVTATFAVTAGEKEQLLNKTEEVLKWFRTLNAADRQRLSFKNFRDKILPLELMQAAALLKQKEQPDMSRMVREILPYLQPTPLECFEIQERLGTETLDSFQQERELLIGGTSDSTTQIKENATRFLKDFLNPAEKMALYREPQTPAEIMKTVDVLVIAGRSTVIRYYLQKFLATNTEPAEYAQIAESLGSQKLLQIANNKEFAPQGNEAVIKIYSEAKKYWQDENVVAQSLEEWQDLEKKIPNAKPLRTLWKGNNVSVSQLIEKLGEIQDEKEINGIIAVILSFSTEGRECLAVALNSENPTLVFNAAYGLAGSIHANEMFLLYPILFAPTSSPISEKQQNKIIQILRDRGLKFLDAKSVDAESVDVESVDVESVDAESVDAKSVDVESVDAKSVDAKSIAAEKAAAELLTRANDYFEKKRSLKPGFDGYVRFWNWDEKEKKPKYIRMMLPAAYRFFAYRYAAQAYRIKPEIRDIRRLYFTTLFERTAYLNGLDTPLDLETSGLTATVRLAEPQPLQQQSLLEDILRFAIRKEHYPAAQVAVQMLGTLKDSEVSKRLLTSPPKSPQHVEPCPLVQAVVAKDRRVRFAALEAIMAIQPNVPYSGSSFVAETLVWFSRSDGRRILVSAHPKLSNAAKTAGFFIGCGYQGELAQTCRNAMQFAAETPDTELIVVDLITPEPSVAEFVQEIRNDPRTADIPVAVLSNNETVLESAPNFQNRSEMQKTDQLHPNAPFSVALSQTYPRVVNDEGAKWINDDLFAKTGVEPVPPAVRLEQAHKALNWIKTIVENTPNGQKIYHFEELEDTVLRALRSGGRIEEGLELAAVIKSGSMQAAIYETAANSLHPIELRRKAAEFFRKSIKNFGILLRGQQVQRLYDRYNASEFEPKETQELLGNLIDFIEK